MSFPSSFLAYTIFKSKLLIDRKMYSIRVFTIQGDGPVGLKRNPITEGPLSVSLSPGCRKNCPKNCYNQTDNFCHRNEKTSLRLGTRNKHCGKAAVDKSSFLQTIYYEHLALLTLLFFISPAFEKSVSRRALLFHFHASLLMPDQTVSKID